jgi:hypothetical protein
MRKAHLLLIFPAREQVLVERFLELPFLLLLLALDAIARPGYGFQSPGVDLTSAAHALSKGTFPNALQCRLDHLQELALVVALRKKEFLGIGARGPVGDILRRILVGNPAIFLGPADRLAQGLLTFFQPFLEIVQLLLVHVS